MLIEDDKSPAFANEGSLEAPFGRRLLDESIIRGLKGVKRYKILVVSFLTSAMFVLLLVRPSDRIAVRTIKPMEFYAEKSQVKVEGDSVIVPPLVLQFKSTPARSAWSQYKPSPIQVISFVGSSEIPAGAEGKAVLLTGATNGLIKARLSEPLKVDGVSLLDAGVLLLGDGSSTEERLYVNFKKAVFKNGKSIAISAQAYEASDMILGLKGSRVGDATLKLAASSGLHFLAGMATGMQPPQFDANGRPQTLSAGQAALGGLRQAASEQAKSYMDDIKNKAPVIEVKSGTSFVVTFDGGN